MMIMNYRLEWFNDRINEYNSKYNKRKYSLTLYSDTIDKKSLSENDVIKILCWKRAGNKTYEQLPKKFQMLIDRAVSKTDEINLFKSEQITSVNFDKILNYISPTGSVIRIFIKHICKPDKYPIFDQHVYRAFKYLIYGEHYSKSLTTTISKKYYEEYSIFYKELCSLHVGTYTKKEIDSALMMFGKEIKNSKNHKKLPISPRKDDEIINSETDFCDVVDTAFQLLRGEPKHLVSKDSGLPIKTLQKIEGIAIRSVQDAFKDFKIDS